MNLESVVTAQTIASTILRVTALTKSGKLRWKEEGMGMFTTPIIRNGTANLRFIEQVNGTGNMVLMLGPIPLIAQPMPSLLAEIRAQVFNLYDNLYRLGLFLDNIEGVE